mmetsp:Transcript_57442/g.163120  ORF Transcript_57442/g.163120 Transcript_57442/m.163120 type:complete len:215 (+) Transcript_57442:178-822(+)
MRAGFSSRRRTTTLLGSRMATDPPGLRARAASAGRNTRMLRGRRMPCGRRTPRGSRTPLRTGRRQRARRGGARRRRRRRGRGGSRRPRLPSRRRGPLPRASRSQRLRWRRPAAWCPWTAPSRTCQHGLSLICILSCWRASQNSASALPHQCKRAVCLLRSNSGRTLWAQRRRGAARHLPSACPSCTTPSAPSKQQVRSPPSAQRGQPRRVPLSS